MAKVWLSETSGEFIWLPAVTGTILNDDVKLNASVGNVTVLEDAGVVEVPVTVLVPLGWGEHNQPGRDWQNQTGLTTFYLNYEITDGTATSPQDYVRGTGQGELVLTSEVPTGVIRIPIVNDSLEEGMVAESFQVTLTGGVAISQRAYGQSSSLNQSSDDTFDGGGWSELVFVNPSASIGIVDNDNPAPAGPSAGGTTSGGTTSGGTTSGGTTSGGTTSGGTTSGGTTTGGTGAGAVNLAGGSPPLPPMTASISVTGASAAEGMGSIVFSIVITNPSSDAITLNYSTSDLSATDGMDYVGASGSINIPANATSSSLTISINDDGDSEPNEDFEVSFSLASGSSATLTNSTAIGTILDDDGGGGGGGGGGGLPSISLSDISIYEDDTAGYVTIFGSLSSASTSPITVNVATVDGTATAGSDYTAVSGGSFTISAGSTGFSFTIPISNDTNVESAETFDVVFSSPSGATLGDGSATVTILDDEPIAQISGPGGLGTSATGGEGTIQGNKIRFQLSVISGGSSTPLFFPAAPVTVNYTISFETGNTATAADFGTLTGSYTFTPSSDPGPRLVNIDIPVTDDTLVEGDETFTITLTSATGATISTTAGSTAGTIADDDSIANNLPAFSNQTYNVKVRRNEGLNTDEPTAPLLFFSQQTRIAKVTATDLDAGETVAYSITGGNEMGLFTIEPSTGRIYATVPGTQLIADQYILQITATDNHTPVPGSTNATLILRVVDTVVLTGKTIATESQSLQLEFRRYTANPDTPIDVPIQILNSTSAPGWNLRISNSFADVTDFDPSSDRTTLFTANPRVVSFNSATGTSVVLVIRATPDGIIEPVEGFQVQLLPSDNPTDYDLYEIDKWQEDLPNDGQKQIGGGSAVTCFVVDDITLFARANQIADLDDAGEIEATNPGACFNDVNQGGIGSCWLTAAIAAFAARPSGRARLQAIMRQTGAMDFEVDLSRAGTTETVSITLNLSRGYSASELSGDFDIATGKAEVWPLVLEQAIGRMLSRSGSASAPC